MCGVVGLQGQSLRAFSVDELTQCLGHRGPNDACVEYVANHKLLFAHTRLSILDLSDAGKQPMYSKSGRWLLTYNGEIYNHRELRNELDGHFVGHSDTETLVESLDRWGFDDTVRRLNGIFAFAAFDFHTRKLYLARDRFGVKPLYFIERAGSIYFSSEVRGFGLLGLPRPTLSQDGLIAFLSLRYTPSPLTMWKDVKRVPPGHFYEIVVEDNSVQCCSYVRAQKGKFQGTFQDALYRYHELLKKSVERQLLSDVPIGVLLSSGIDSAIISALSVELGAKPRTFTVGYAGNHVECEIEGARSTAKFLGLEHEYVYLTSSSCWSNLIPALKSVEEPLGTTSMLPMWELARIASKSVNVVLTGQGSDEPWGGYRRYRSELLYNLLPHKVPWATFHRVLKKFPKRVDFIERALRSFSKMSDAERFLEVWALFDQTERSELVESDREVVVLSLIQEWLNWCDNGGNFETVERMMLLDARMNLPDDLLLYGDKISMAHSIEARVPMLDNDVMGFIESLPRTMKLSLFRSKILHKAMAEKFLPKQIVHRPKLGFQVPIGDWLKSDWSQNVYEMLFDTSSKLSLLVDLNVVKRHWDAHQSGRLDSTRQLFAFLGLAVWAEGNY